MNSSEQQTKPKLKYKICAETTTGYAFPVTIHATITLADAQSRLIYNEWTSRGQLSRAACYITIGITRA
jgi:hypothetical protein